MKIYWEKFTAGDCKPHSLRHIKLHMHQQQGRAAAEWQLQTRPFLFSFTANEKGEKTWWNSLRSGAGIPGRICMQSRCFAGKLDAVNMGGYWNSFEYRSLPALFSNARWRIILAFELITSLVSAALDLQQISAAEHVLLVGLTEWDECWQIAHLKA